MSEATQPADAATEMDEPQGTKETISVGNLTPEMAGALAYLLSPISGIALYVMEEEDEFTRFHAMQSIAFGVAWAVVFGIISVLTSITFGIAGLLFLPALPVAMLMWAFLMYKAYTGQEYMLPVLGQFAKDQVAGGDGAAPAEN